MAWGLLPDVDQTESDDAYPAHTMLKVVAGGPVPLADVSATLERFQLQQRLHQRQGRLMPAIRVPGEETPLPAAVLPPIG
ncbi:MAG TPA: hypothetical protein VF714_10630, partial [Jatrophihabitans sp.]